MGTIVGSSPERPAPIGMTVRTKIERGDRYSAPEVYNLEITLLSVVRGDEAWQRLTSEGGAAESAPPGMQYVLAEVRFGYFSKGRGFSHSGEPYRIGPGSFAAVPAGGGREYELPQLTRRPQPSLLEALFVPQDVREGWIVLLVPESEKHPLLMFKREYLENTYGKWGEVLFQLWR